jgi:hypothetical protein
MAPLCEFNRWDELRIWISRLRTIIDSAVLYYRLRQRLMNLALMYRPDCLAGWIAPLCEFNQRDELWINDSAMLYYRLRQWLMNLALLHRPDCLAGSMAPPCEFNRWDRLRIWILRLRTINDSAMLYYRLRQLLMNLALMHRPDCLAGSMALYVNSIGGISCEFEFHDCGRLMILLSSIPDLGNDKWIWLYYIGRIF